jgi:epithelial splicing regulatory protein 1/2
LVTDGQLPLRQCLHPESGAKEIQLPLYYWKFSDLKKEYVHTKSGDLSRALISINDVSKLPNMPALPQFASTLADILTGELEIFSVSLLQ